MTEVESAERGPWVRETFRLPQDHGFKASPGNAIFIADRGAVRFEIPSEWVIEPAADAIKFHDRPPPDDDCLLQVSVMYLNPAIDWTGVPVADLLKQVVHDDDRGITQPGKVITRRRAGLRLAWLEGSFFDPTEQRDARARACLALAGAIMPFITMDFWVEDTARFAPVWDVILRTLRIGEYDVKLTGDDPRHWALLERPSGE